MMAPNASGAETLHDSDHGAFAYSPDHYSDSELDGSREKGASGKPRTRLGYQRISIACCMTLSASDLIVVYCRRRKIRCLPPVGDGDRCQNCARQQRDCVVQPIAGSNRKGGRNQANALSTDPMPYAEALSMSRQNNSLSQRRASQKTHHETYYPTNLSIPYPYSSQMTGVPFSAPPHVTSVPFLSSESTYPDPNRRPPFKHMQSAPGSLYTVPNQFDRAGQDGYSWAPTPHYTVPSQEPLHPTQDLSTDATNPFWKLNVTSPTASAADMALPPPRLSTQSSWVPNMNSNYTHERATLPTPSHEAIPQPGYYTPAIVSPAISFPAGSSHHEEHCEPSHWPRTANYRGSQ